MKILVFTTLYPNAVQENHGIFVEKRLLELIKRHAVEATVIAPVPWYPSSIARRRNLPAYHQVPSRELRSGVEVWHPRYPVVPGISWRIAPWFLHWFSRRLAGRLHQENRFELVDAHFAFPDGVAAGFIAKKLGIPCVITARGSDINDSPRFLLPRSFLQRTFRDAAQLIAVSRRLKDRMIELGADVKKISVIPNGVDTDVFKPQDSTGVTKTFGVSSPYMLSVGSLRELKGHHLLIEAMAGNKDLHRYALLIAGTGTMEAELRRLIKRLDIDSRVKLIGEVPNDKLAALYSGAELFVLASSNEGCPNVVLEALACNTRVVATDVGAVPDLLPEALHPFMIKARNPEAIGAKVLACVNADIGANVPRDRATALGWAQTCEALEKIMRSVRSPV